MTQSQSRDREPLSVHTSRATFGRLCAAVAFVLVGTAVTVSAFLESTTASGWDGVTEVSPSTEEPVLAEPACEPSRPEEVVVVPTSGARRS